MPRLPSEELIARLRTDTAFREKTVERLKPKIVRGFLEGAIENGQIDPRGKSEVELLQALLPYVQHNSSGRILFTIDHTRDLRSLADRLHKEGEYGVELVVLATWVEHVLNEMVLFGAMRAGLNESTAKQAIRDSPISAKLGWLLRLLRFRPFASKHAAVLQKLAERRNQFVHYKWSYAKIDSSPSDEELPAFLASCRKSLRYLAYYRTSHALLGAKNVVRKLSSSHERIANPD